MTLSVLPGKRLLLVSLSILIASCGLIPRIPIQMSRVVQVEQYEQKFVVSPEARDAAQPVVAADGTCNNATISHFDGVFLRLVGPQNWRNLSATYGLPEICDELLAGSISLKGNIQFVVYLLAGDHDQFQFEGTGHYFLIQKNEGNKIMMAGDFEVIPTLHSIGDLRRGYLDVQFQVITTKVLEQDTYLHESDLKYRIFMDTSRADDDTYNIDYARKHEAYLGDDLFGEIEIADDGYNTKLLDLRGISLLQSDYESVTRSQN